MVLVDTSVWVRFLADRKPYAAELDRLLDQGEVAAHLIYGELLVRDQGGRSKLVSAYGVMHRVAAAPHSDVVDVHLLASAIIAGVPLWTADERLASVSREVGAAYDPGA